MPRAAFRADELADLRRRTAAAASRLHAAGGPDAVTMRAVADALGVSAMTPYRYVAGKDELLALVRADAFARFADALGAALVDAPADAGRSPAAKRRPALVDAPADAGRVPTAKRTPSADGTPTDAGRAPTARRGAGRGDDRTMTEPPGAVEGIAALRRLKRAYVAFAVAEPHAYRAMFELAQPEASAQTPELVHESARAFELVHRAVRTAIAGGALAGESLVVARLLWANTHGLVSLHLAGRLSARALAQLAAIDHELAAFRAPAARARRRAR